MTPVNIWALNLGLKSIFGHFYLFFAAQCKSDKNANHVNWLFWQKLYIVGQARLSSTRVVILMWNHDHSYIDTWYSLNPKEKLIRSIGCTSSLKSNIIGFFDQIICPSKDYQERKCRWWHHSAQLSTLLIRGHPKLKWPKSY